MSDKPDVVTHVPGLVTRPMRVEAVLTILFALIVPIAVIVYAVLL